MLYVQKLAHIHLNLVSREPFEQTGHTGYTSFISKMTNRHKLPHK